MRPEEPAPVDCAAVPVLEAAVGFVPVEPAPVTVLLPVAYEEVLIGVETPGQFIMQAFIVLAAFEPLVKSLGKDAMAQARAQLYASQGRSSAGQIGAPFSSFSYSDQFPVAPIRLKLPLYVYLSESTGGNSRVATE